MSSNARVALCVLLAFLAALGGAWVGRAWFAPAGRPAELHDLLHHRLRLDPGQQHRLGALEERFAVQQRALELDLRAANAALAAAIGDEHGEGPRVAAAVDRVHAAMGAMQKATLAHLFAMRRLLRPDQTALFDRAVAKALTADPG